MLQKKIIQQQQQVIVNHSNILLSPSINTTTSNNSNSSISGSNTSYQSIFSSPFPNTNNSHHTEYLSFSPISDLTEMSDTSSLNGGGSSVTTPSGISTPTNTLVVDGAELNNKRQQLSSGLQSQQSSSSSLSNSTTNPILQESSSTEELNWSSLNIKMKAYSKYDSKRGSVLIEHLSEFNKLASSQIILGEEVEKESSPNLSERSENNNNLNQQAVSTPTSSQPSSSTPTPTPTTLDNLVLQGINLFNEKPKKGIEYFIQHKLLERKPELVAEFLHRCPLLNKKSIGDYLGDIDEFCIQTLESLIARFNFQDLDFDMALRQLLYCFLLPGEAQKIDRIMQKFANQFYKDNLKSGVFEDPDAVYMLAFALILLNTDVHNPQIKQKMSKAKFSRSLNGINSGKNLPLEYIEDIYDRIFADEIKMEPTATLFPYACKKGWLNIRVKGRVTDKWSRKWCILSDGTLYFFRKPTDTNPVRYLHPDTVITTQKEMKGRKNCFILNHSSPPISIQSLMSLKDPKNPQKSFNPQALFQQLATFGKEKKREAKFWDSVSERYQDQKAFDISMFNDSFDTDSVGSFDTLSESSNYYDDDVSTGSSVTSNSPLAQSQLQAEERKKQTAYSLRLGNRKTKDQLQEYENEYIQQSSTTTTTTTTTSVITTPPPTPNTTTTTTTTTPSKPPIPAKTYLNTPGTPNGSQTQPKPTFIKQGSSSLIRSSSISTFSTPNQSNISTANSIKSSNSSSSSTTNSAGSASISQQALDQQNKKSIEDIMKLQEKLIKSSKQQSTVILNADSKREMDSWIRLILSQFKNK
ncbi:pleckstrin (PH) domain-containing protein [Tieghemostelium lacteum]|uniref:Pleckstrin (PH) domain-containing protein n=1 Tax=Tieghemostelium lacteum TaxID=361077 RepID=A0A151ZDQ0_TIELA|nr:pleckstrin (PH) domain-containing protein [Tieghemostelium lacteum]|eukprot:KYQ92083.1 pleckstrin (PH) domain-containing protein [Tieghemostelium lacteum]